MQDKEILLFSDGSVNTKSKIGYGAYFFATRQEIEARQFDIKLKRFEQTSSTKLELQTLLYALNEVQDFNCKIKVYTDSQNIIGLEGRRERLEKNNYRSSKNKLLNNYELYQEFYKLIDKLDCKFYKVQGHLKSNQKDDVDKLFAIVDRASRKALRTNEH
jgi:ribonuclease HI